MKWCYVSWGVYSFLTPSLHPNPHFTLPSWLHPHTLTPPSHPDSTFTSPSHPDSTLLHAPILTPALLHPHTLTPPSLHPHTITHPHNLTPPSHSRTLTPHSLHPHNLISPLAAEFPQCHWLPGPTPERTLWVDSYSSPAKLIENSFMLSHKPLSLACLATIEPTCSDPQYLDHPWYLRECEEFSQGL